MGEVGGGTLAAGIWDRVIAAEDPVLTPEEARAVLRSKFTAPDRERVDELSEEARAGSLTAAEERKIGRILRLSPLSFS